MSLPDDENMSPTSQLASNLFTNLLDSLIVDIASECHRVSRLGFDRNLDQEEEEVRLSAQARVRVADPGNSGVTSNKYVVDIFGQTHPPVAKEQFDCMKCGRAITAGRFAPHLEKCMGKGRKASQKVTRSSIAAQARHTRSNNNANRLPNGASSYEVSNISEEQ
ncbi:hypothetical protein ACFE04_014684 [Oxalis oulophora]